MQQGSDVRGICQNVDIPRLGSRGFVGNNQLWNDNRGDARADDFGKRVSKKGARLVKLDQRGIRFSAVRFQASEYAPGRAPRQLGSSNLLKYESPSCTSMGGNVSGGFPLELELCFQSCFVKEIRVMCNPFKSPSSALVFAGIPGGQRVALGRFTFANGQLDSFLRREVKCISINTVCENLKIAFEGCYVHGQNIAMQVCLDGLVVLGDKTDDSSQEGSARTNQSEGHGQASWHEASVKMSFPSSQNMIENVNQSLKDIKAQFAKSPESVPAHVYQQACHIEQRMKNLVVAKDRAVCEEDFERAKEFKRELGKLTQRAMTFFSGETGIIAAIPVAGLGNDGQIDSVLGQVSVHQDHSADVDEELRPISSHSARASGSAAFAIINGDPGNAAFNSSSQQMLQMPVKTQMERHKLGPLTRLPFTLGSMNVPVPLHQAPDQRVNMDQIPNEEHLARQSNQQQKGQQQQQQQQPQALTNLVPVDRIDGWEKLINDQELERTWPQSHRSSVLTDRTEDSISSTASLKPVAGAVLIPNTDDQMTIMTVQANGEQTILGASGDSTTAPSAVITECIAGSQDRFRDEGAASPFNTAQAAPTSPTISNDVSQGGNKDEELLSRFMEQDGSDPDDTIVSHSASQENEISLQNTPRNTAMLAAELKETSDDEDDAHGPAVDDEGDLQSPHPKPCVVTPISRQSSNQVCSPGPESSDAAHTSGQKSTGMVESPETSTSPLSLATQPETSAPTAMKEATAATTGAKGSETSPSQQVQGNAQSMPSSDGPDETQKSQMSEIQQNEPGAHETNESTSDGQSKEDIDSRKLPATYVRSLLERLRNNLEEVSKPDPESVRQFYTARGNEMFSLAAEGFRSGHLVCERLARNFAVLLCDLFHIIPLHSPGEGALDLLRCAVETLNSENVHSQLEEQLAEVLSSIVGNSKASASAAIGLVSVKRAVGSLQDEGALEDKIKLLGTLIEVMNARRIENDYIGQEICYFVESAIWDGSPQAVRRAADTLLESITHRS